MKRMPSLYRLLLLAVLGLLSCSRVSLAQVDSLLEAAARNNQRLMEEIMLRTDVPGMSAAVGRNGKVLWAGGFGYANLEHRVPVNDETLFRIGSISKPMTAAAVGLLVQDGVLDIDQPVQTYLPDFPVKRWPITTREAAGHIAGIRHYRGDEMLSARRYETVRDGLAIFEDDSLLFEPGQRFSYSSYGWNLVSAVAEAAAGEPFLELMRRRVFGPLHMEHTAADWTDRIIAGRTAFYERRPDGHVYNAPFVDNSYKWAGGGFLSTPSDLVRFAMAHADAGFMSSATTEDLWTPLILDSGDTTDYGVGWFIGTDLQGRRIVFHGGGSVGGTSFLLYYPDQNVAAAIVANSSGPTSMEAAAALAAPYLDPGRLTASEDSAATGLYECWLARGEDQPEPLRIHLLGTPGNYWGRVHFRDDDQQILDVYSARDTTYVTTIQDGGWIALMSLHGEQAGLAGHRNGRPMTCAGR